MTTFYIIRHGQTDWNAQGRWQGSADIPLNDSGRLQARQLAARLRAQRLAFDAIYSSDLQRAWETATLVASTLGGAAQPLPALREIDVGAWSGLTHAEVKTHFPELLARFESGEDVPRGGNGETFSQLYQRVVGAVEHLAIERRGQTLALVSHGGPVRALLLHAARGEVGALPRPLHIGNTALSVVVREAMGWRILAVNDMAHLDATMQAPDMMDLRRDDAERA